MEILYDLMAVLSKSLVTITGTSLLLLALISPRSQRARLYLNALIYVGGMGVCSLWGVIASIFMSLIPGQRLNINKVVARSFYYLAGTLTGVRFEVEGEEHFQTRPAVLVGNHQTGIDILYLGRIFPGYASIMAKQELKYTPLLGQFMALSGAVFIDRKNRNNSIKAFDQVGNDMKRRNLSLWVFPEGTRSNLPFPDLLPFKKGAFHLAVQAGVPVIPVVCENYNRLFDGKTRFESGTVKIKVLPPVPTKGLGPDDVTKLTTDVREMMLAELQKMDRDRQQADLAGSAKPERMGGLAGWIGRIVGTGASHNRVVRRVDRQEQTLRKAGTDGRDATDYGLVTEKAKQPAGDSQLRKRAPASNIESSSSSIGETDDDGNVVVKTPSSK